MNNIRKFIYPLTLTCMLLLLISGCKKHETYIVTFNANGGTGTMEAQTFTEGEAQALSRNAFTYDGYTFSGWNTVQGGSGASYTDGQTITATADMTLYAQWESNGITPTPPEPQPTTGTLNGHDWIDLGLPSGTKWATCNVGADTPEGYGNYYAWGETTPKEIYSWESYIYAEGTSWEDSRLSKYCNNSSVGNNGFTDNLVTLEASDDAATANWGAGWRMPSKDDFDELVNNCTVSWGNMNGVSVNKFTGPNGNSIFLPAAGYYDNETLNVVGSNGYYWSNSLETDGPNEAFNIGFYSDNIFLGSSTRICGFSVRPVYVN